MKDYPNINYLKQKYPLKSAIINRIYITRLGDKFEGYGTSILESLNNLEYNCANNIKINHKSKVDEHYIGPNSPL